MNIALIHLETCSRMAARLAPLSLVLAAWLQASPILRWMLANLGPSGPLSAIVVRVGGVSAALLGGVQAVSGATTPTFDGPFQISGAVGQSLNFRLNVIPFEDRFMRSFSASGLPPGVNIVTLGDNSALLSGTPSQGGTFFATVFGWRYTPVSNPDNQIAGNSVSDSVVLTISGGTTPASITQHPASIRRLPGTNAVFTALSQGTGPITYHWRKDATPSALSSSATLTVSNLTANDAGAYSVIVSNSAGTQTSSGAVLSIASRPVISPSKVNSSIRLAFTGETGVTYRVETATTVTATAWNTLTNLTPLADGPIAITNTPASSNLFYRLRLLGP